MDNSSTAQIIVFILMVFEHFSTKEELLTVIPLRTSTRREDIYNAVKTFFVKKKVLPEKLVSISTDGAPAMVGCHADTSHLSPAGDMRESDRVLPCNELLTC